MQALPAPADDKPKRTRAKKVEPADTAVKRTRVKKAETDGAVASGVKKTSTRKKASTSPTTRKKKAT
jgi:hypothetical protein